MSAELEFEGRDIKEAVEKACFTLQVSEAELDYDVVHQGGRKLFGLLGGKNARIRVTKKDPSGKELVQDLIKSTFGDEFEKRDSPTQKEEIRETAGKERAPRQSRAADGSRSGRRHQVADANISVVYDQERVCQAAARILELMGITGSRVNSQQHGSELHLEITGDADELEMLLRRRGAVLDALQFLINKIHGVKGGRIFVDCNDFRSRHEEDISELARRLGAKAKRLRKPVTINSLNAHDRRLVHLALQEDQELRSRSKGEGEFKKIVIYPANSQRRRPRSKNSSSTAEAV
jgi:spoIIIJ-associated protein